MERVLCWIVEAEWYHLSSWALDHEFLMILNRRPQEWVSCQIPEEGTILWTRARLVAPVMSFKIDLTSFRIGLMRCRHVKIALQMAFFDWSDVAYWFFINASIKIPSSALWIKLMQLVFVIKIKKIYTKDFK